MDRTHLIKKLTPLAHTLTTCKTAKEKLRALLPYHENLKIFEGLTINAKVIIASLFAIEQGHHIFKNLSSQRNPERFLNKLIEKLIPVENCYQPIGGIVGYHLNFLKLLKEKKTCASSCKKVFAHPPGVPIDKNTKHVIAAIHNGLKSLPQMAEIYPVAGAADRLDLHHEISKEALPAAELTFLGMTLLERLITDLQAREYVYFKLYDKQIITPIVLMTSLEKNNDFHIRTILKNYNFFGRLKSKYYIILQPQVPVIGSDGNWDIKDPFDLSMKPGGHGMLWKIAKDQRAFHWLKKQKRKKAIIRQINNPIAGVDNTLTVLQGIGCKENRSFGFVSCERVVGSSEGMNVLFKRKIASKYEYGISNIEYTDFEKQGIEDKAASFNSPFSTFPANTNILFVDLAKVEKAAKKHPFPGMLINIKPANHENALMPSGRLECTMQNIADYISTTSTKPLSKKKLANLKTFLLYNTRQKTIAPTKRLYKEGLPLQDTPEGALLQLLNLNKNLLKQCGFTIPKEQNEKEFIEKGPDLFFIYHPALGPYFSLIAQKLKKGKISPHSELNLDISEVEIENLELQGSLIIKAENPLGHTTAKRHLRYSNLSGKCVLKNVVVANRGIKENAISNYWKYQLDRHETLFITIEGNGEFIAKDVVFNGSYHIKVPKGIKMTAQMQGDHLYFEVCKITDSKEYWSYTIGKNGQITLMKSH